MNKFFIIIGALLTVFGAGISVFTDVPVAEYVGVGVAFAGAMLTAITTYNKSEKKDWKVILAIVLIGVGASCLVIAGISETVISQIITLVVGVVTLIAGIITSVVAVKSKTE